MLNKDDKAKLIDALNDTYEYQLSAKNKNKLSFRNKTTNSYDQQNKVITELAKQFRRCERPFSEEEISEFLNLVEEHLLKEKNSKYDAAIPKISVPELSVTSTWILEKLSDPDCPFYISKRADYITYGAAETSANDALILSWLNMKVKDLGLRKIYTNGDIADGWKLLKTHFLSSQKLLLREKFNYTGSKFIDEFTKYIYDYLQIYEDYDVFEMMFKHWMWCLKRRIYGLPVVWHIWINFNGSQGIGKSQMLNRMFKPMEEFVVITNLKVMNDVEREYRKFTDNYILIFDDLNTGENSDSDLALNDNAVDAIKQIMTQEMLTIRQFQSQDQIRVKNTFIPISTANRHLYDVIYDGDAMRRWFEFNCKRDTPPASYDELNAMLERFPEALQGIDHNNDKGYWLRDSTTGRKIIDIQKHYIPTNTSTNEWIRKCNIKPDTTMNPNNKFNTVIYSHYKDYCRTVGKYIASMARVETILRRLWPQACDENNIYLVECDVMDPTNNTLVHKNDEPKAFTKEDKIATFETPMDEIDWGF